MRMEIEAEIKALSWLIRQDEVVVEVTDSQNKLRKAERSLLLLEWVQLL